MFPTVMLNAAMIAKMYWTISISKPAIDFATTNMTRKILKNTTRPIFLDPVARKIETGVEDPSYTSGAHMWNGTAAILNP